MTKIKRNIQVDTIFNILGLTVSGWGKEYKEITKFLSPEPKAKWCRKDYPRCRHEGKLNKWDGLCPCPCHKPQSKAEKKIEHLNLANWIPSKSISGKKRVANVEIMIENKINQIIDLLNSEKKC